MPRARHEADAQAFQVVIGIVYGMDLQLATVAGARIHMPDRERAGEPAQYTSVQPAGDQLQCFVSLRWWLGDDAGLRYLLEYLIHRLTDLHRYS